MDSNVLRFNRPLMTRLSLLVIALIVLALATPVEADRRSRRKKRKERKKRQKQQQEEARKKPVAPAPAPTPPPAPPPADNTPWGKGVSTDKKAAAQALLEAGNNLFLAKDYRGALAKYETAIQSWDHPAIRFNIVRTLIQLDRNLEAYDHLQSALKYGAAPLEDTVYQEARNYQKILAASIAELEITCEQQGVMIAVDGNAFLSCPGAKTVRMSPGKHIIVGKKKDFLTESKDIALFSGKKETASIKLLSLEDATVTERHWVRWKPWAVVGSGAAATGLGFLLRSKAVSDMAKYGTGIADDCGQMGCLPTQISTGTKDLKSRAILENTMAVSAIVTGSALLVGGLTMVILNRPRQVVPEQPPGNRLQVVPAMSANSMGIEVLGRF